VTDDSPPEDPPADSPTEREATTAASPLDAVDFDDETEGSDVASVAAHGTDGARERGPGERLRRRLGLSETRWELLVSVLLFLPYPLFVLLIVTGTFDGLTFLLFTLAYSVVAIVLNLVL
jgi:hypothetical protein